MNNYEYTIILKKRVPANILIFQVLFF